MANLTLSPVGRAGGAPVSPSSPPSSRGRPAAAPASIRNAPPCAPTRRLWLDGIPRAELDALAAALRQGPLDAHFFLTLQPHFHRTALAAPMAQGLVDDALDRLLPAGLPAAQRAAWRSSLMALLTLPRVDWEVQCAPLRALLTDAVARRNTLLRAMRDALYRPLDQPRRAWNAAVDAERALGVADAREVAHHMCSLSPSRQRDAVRQQLRNWMPTLTPAQLDRAVAQAAAAAALNGACIDARSALPALFDGVDDAGVPLIGDAQRARILATLDQLAGGAPDPLLATQGGRGDRLGQWLLSVADRAALAATARPSLRRALGDAVLFVAGLAPGLKALRWGAADAALPTPREAHTVTMADAPPAVASGASRQGGRSMLAMAAGLVGGGLGVATLGWRWVSGDTQVIAPTGDAQPCRVPKPEPDPARVDERTRHVVRLLDAVIDRDGEGSIWDALWQRVHQGAGGDATSLRGTVATLLESNEVAREVIDALDGLPPAEGRVRVRRALRPLPMPRGGGEGLDASEHDRLDAATRLLVDVAQQAPPPQQA
uniref:hypothetical protein n=1 Tax=uncultured Stenotrophomonas sp. TaxID=165438 RepID=UPI0028D40DD3